MPIYIRIAQQGLGTLPLAIAIPQSPCHQATIQIRCCENRAEFINLELFDVRTCRVTPPACATKVQKVVCAVPKFVRKGCNEVRANPDKPGSQRKELMTIAELVIYV